MFKKLVFVALFALFLSFLVGCSRTVVRTVCDCDCCACGGGWEETDRYDDPGEYEGWRD